MNTDLWLTRIIPNPHNHSARSDIRSAVGLHHRVMMLFPDGLGANARHMVGALFRVDETPLCTSVMIQSALAPNLERLDPAYGQAQSRPLSPLLHRLTKGTAIHYRLTANATRKLGKRTIAGRPGQVIPLHDADADVWWQRQAEKAGLALLSGHNTRLPDARGSRGSDKFTVTHARTRFDGTATVTDPDALRHHLAAGFGRGKSYGCGLLTVAPAT
ncbi:type I-E CRISPR-associated protein Cas6/Cse3/CasE [Streptomyces sp. NPDC050085]|uniref:type I-E CRISPR-associated protein Cas6/Cse3/CasE n=1 Tax=Streptomyces sp. NPDC050085 TaxID=3365600 RepID=UPI00379B78C0